MQEKLKTTTSRYVFSRECMATRHEAGCLIRALPPFLQFRGLDAPWNSLDDLEAISEQVAKASRSRTVAKFSAGQFGSPVDLFVKRYHFRNLLKRVLRAPRISRAREEFDLGWELLERGMKTPRPVWMAEQSGPLPAFSMIATEALPEAESAFDSWMLCQNQNERQTLCAVLGEYTRQMHDKGFYHDDYKSAHLLLPPGKPVCAKEYFVIDLLGGKMCKTVADDDRAYNLFQLIQSFIPRKRDFGFSAEYRMTLLNAYSGSATEALHWARLVEKAAHRKGKSGHSDNHKHHGHHGPKA